ncbi:MAG: carbamoyltransferase C-terminal domain-containing protein, partial [Nonlabens sp.]|uniref:carbamoyltransferase C-terminal domain-containing protein n=1 Tax=Nonlabens sp. TaxID=1888209 RepID=UPI003EF3E49D
GNIIGWFQGPMEIGPRALGSRSILANPAFPQMKDKINAEVKFREAYRPFAPSALVESYKDFFDLEVEAPFMLKICNVLEDKQRLIPAITHVDGSARLQTVKKELHPRYHEVIQKLGERTGIPVVLNTSFNIQGEPVVESPKDALRCFYSTGLDYLAIGNYLLSKRNS